MSSATLPPTSQKQPTPSDEEIEEEMCLLDQEEADSLLERVQDLVTQHFDDFPDDQLDDEAARYAAKMTKASITDGTRTGHLRIIRHYITFHLRRNAKWDAKRVDEQTPRDIATFITQKCGRFRGQEAVSTRAALTMVYLTIGNIPKDIRRKSSRHAQILLAYLPTSKLEHITNKASRRRVLANLFHSCMSRILAPLKEAGVDGMTVVSGDGVARRGHPILAAYVGDYPEQFKLLVACVKNTECPVS